MTLEWPWPILRQGQIWLLMLFYGKKGKQWIFQNYCCHWHESLYMQTINWVNEGMWVLKVKVISLPYIFQVLYVLCFTRPRYQVSVYRTICPLFFFFFFFFLGGGGGGGGGWIFDFNIFWGFSTKITLFWGVRGGVETYGYFFGVTSKCNYFCGLFTKIN